MERRRFTDKIRALADAAWERGDKALSTELHAQARHAEADRHKWCTCGSKTVMNTNLVKVLADRMIEVDIVHLGTPTACASCGNPIKRGQRTVTDGKVEFDTCECLRSYDVGALDHLESAQV